MANQLAITDGYIVARYLIAPIMAAIPNRQAAILSFTVISILIRFMRAPLLKFYGITRELDGNN